MWEERKCISSKGSGTPLVRLYKDNAYIRGLYNSLVSQIPFQKQHLQQNDAMLCALVYDFKERVGLP